ncbi:SDR family NAD(P)-dependent oxidoreductase [Halalkalicoccus sp. NIPERK01]|uniref:SDR family NAD(P)-dependent oxidoreductase n=1 Tax=Halalkalicoccus sp. NIPERK01 TaxID=3053469 RepID=UPI00256F61D2|nr:SDR family NAD(P)-dependent oxidoreductase [Halalkalicoccus sp. NIPERK01]MDL5363443.1 SDR family NAD(P)-dependent oxidoreductase [Halalkalicoccus sp. NIPERK01]
MDLDGRTALVTGSSRNIGRTIATTMAEAGADVGITARDDEEGCKDTAREVEAAGSNAAVALGDLAEPADIEDIVGRIREELGPIDVLVNNATVRPMTPFFEVEPAELDHVLDVNLKGQFLLTQHVVSDMLDVGHGSIVNLIGAMVFLGRTGKAHSYGSKMGIAGYVRQLASEFGPEGIRVNGLSPGLIDTDRDETFAGHEEVIEATPLQRMGTTEEVADVCCFLASDRASFITGQVIHVNGGSYPTPNVITPE